MHLPGFNAEASLYRMNRCYFAAGGVHQSARTAQVAPSQTLGQGGLGLWPMIKCCGRYQQFGGRIYCIYQQQRPGESCVCTHLYNGEPFIKCTPWVFEP
jgi:hypothetical protein